MARKITIPITDHDTHCNTGYNVSYKIDGAEYWTTQPWSVPPIEITNLLDDTLYNIEIVRNCCDGIQSTPLVLNVNTAMLGAPENFIATGGPHQVELDWDEVAGATAYRVERAQDAGFSIAPTIIYNGTSTAILDDELPADTTYYYRVKATAPYTEGPYATDNATTTP